MKHYQFTIEDKRFEIITYSLSELPKKSKEKAIQEHLDFLNSKYTNFLDGTIKPIDPSSVNQWLIKEGNWFTVSYSLAEEKIKNRRAYFVIELAINGKIISKGEGYSKKTAEQNAAMNGLKILDINGIDEESN